MRPPRGLVCASCQLIRRTCLCDVWHSAKQAADSSEQASTSHGSDMKGCLMLTLTYATRVLMLFGTVP